MLIDETLAQLRSQADPHNVEGMAHFGICVDQALGLSMPAVRAIARDLRRESPSQRHELACQLWETGIHEARILAALVDTPKLVSEDQMERWVSGFDSWDVCDQVCGNLFDGTPFALAKAVAWSAREETFVKRAGFSMMAYLAVHEKKMPDAVFLDFLPLIEREAGDERNFVRKAVNWALRQIGKRNPALNAQAIACAERLHQTGSRSARWVAADALRELTSTAVQEKLKKG